MERLGEVITFLYPDALARKDYEVRDESDGNGPYIRTWNVKDSQGNDVPEPTAEELQAAWEAYLEEEVDKPLPVSDVDILGMQLAEKDLQIMELEGTQEIIGQQLVEKDMQLMAMEETQTLLGQQLVEKDLQLMEAQQERDAMGTQLVDLEIRLLNLEAMNNV